MEEQEVVVDVFQSTTQIWTETLGTGTATGVPNADGAPLRATAAASPVVTGASLASTAGPPGRQTSVSTGGRQNRSGGDTTSASSASGSRREYRGVPPKPYARMTTGGIPPNMGRRG